MVLKTEKANCCYSNCWQRVFRRLVLLAVVLIQSGRSVSIAGGARLQDLQQEQQQQDENTNGGGRKDPSHKGIFESLWKTLKQTMDMTATALTSKANAAKTSEHDRHLLSSSQRKISPSRRIHFFRQTLQDHYTQQFVQSFPDVDHSQPDQPYSEYPPKSKSIASSRSITTNDHSKNSKKKKNSSSTHQSAAQRWSHHDNEDGSKCYYYKEHANAYWTVQWCPSTNLTQGLRTAEEMTFQGRHNLGQFRSSWKDTTIKTVDMTTQFAKAVQTHFPQATVELYDDGDYCQGYRPGPTSRRFSTIVLHHRDTTSQHCGKDWTDGLSELSIESVEEPQTCRYIVHVCHPTQTTTPPTAKSSMDKPLIHLVQSGTTKDNDLKQRMKQMERLLNAYLHETEADAYYKANMDRTTSLHVGLPPLPPSRVEANVNLIKKMFMHAYDAYMHQAFPASEIKPITCQPASFELVKIPGLTLIDSLDTLVILGNYTEFARSVERLRGLHLFMQKTNSAVQGAGLFGINKNVSVFETNIRVLGGLLSAHQLAEAFLSSKVRVHEVWSEENMVLGGSKELATLLYGDKVPDDNDENPSEGDESPKTFHGCSVSSEMDCPPFGEQPREACETTTKNQTTAYWEYDGFLLELAQDIGDRLLPAFSTRTGIPFGTVNLLYGIPRDETPIASLAGGGTLSLEMELLSRLTGDPNYGRAAKLASRALWMRRSQHNILGKHICSHRGEWTETLSGIGSNSDSYYEYLIKHHILFPEDHDFWLQMVPVYGGVYNHSRLGEWYGDVDINRGLSSSSSIRRVFEALMAFYPGMQSLLGEVTPAAHSLNSFFLVREHLGFLPERFSFVAWRIDPGGDKHFLRPELLESAYFLHRAVKGSLQQFRHTRHSNDVVDSSGWQWAADFALHDLEKYAKATCGYASLQDLREASVDMDDWHGQSGSVPLQMDDMPSFFLSETLKYLYLTFDENNILHSDQDRDWVFTTEAHPIHYEPSPRLNGNGPSEIQNLKARLIERLKLRAQGPLNPESSHMFNLNQEKWTTTSPAKMYLHQTQPIELLLNAGAATKLNVANEWSHGPKFWSSGGFFETILPEAHQSLQLDFFQEVQTLSNAAHVTLKSQGNQHFLTNSCPNHYLPDFRWIYAMNGGSTDYSDVYFSSATDKASSTNNFIMLGAVDALAILGSGVHVGELHHFSKKCAIAEPTQPSNDSPNNKEDESQQQSQIFSMGGDLGDFEVSAFPAGGGFYVKHVNSGETLVATLIQSSDLKEATTAYVMVHATIPMSEEVSPTRGHEIQQNHQHRSVVMADLLGNAFKCEVHLLTALPDRKDGRLEGEFSSDDNNYRLLESFPCAPAMFGPAHMSELANTDGAFIEATVQMPEQDDLHGCKAPNINQVEIHGETEDDTCKSDEGIEFESEVESQCGPIESVHYAFRGRCTFEEKASNLKKRFKAKAVIVVNVDDDFFVMSGREADQPTLPAEDYPLTVMVTRSDGNSLISISDILSEKEDFDLRIRISLTPDSSKIVGGDNTVTVQNSKFWPAVRANAGGLQIYASGGWAVHAVQRVGRVLPLEWQLYIMQYER